MSWEWLRLSIKYVGGWLRLSIKDVWGMVETINKICVGVGWDSIGYEMRLVETFNYWTVAVPPHNKWHISTFISLRYCLVYWLLKLCTSVSAFIFNISVFCDFYRYSFNIFGRTLPLKMNNFNSKIIFFQDFALSFLLLVTVDE